MSVLQRSEQIRGTFDEILQNLLTLVKVRRNCVDFSIGSFESHTKFWNTTEIILLSRFFFRRSEMRSSASAGTGRRSDPSCPFAIGAILRSALSASR